MVKINLILAMIAISANLISYFDFKKGREFTARSENIKAIGTSNPVLFIADAGQTSRFVEEIISNPIFFERRPEEVGNAVSKTMISIEGLHTSVELIGTIGSGEKGTAAFSIGGKEVLWLCLLYTSPSPRDKRQSRMPSSA